MCFSKCVLMDKGLSFHFSLLCLFCLPLVAACQIHPVCWRANQHLQNLFLLNYKYHLWGTSLADLHFSSCWQRFLWLFFPHSNKRHWMDDVTLSLLKKKDWNPSELNHWAQDACPNWTPGPHWLYPLNEPNTEPQAFHSGTHTNRLEQPHRLYKHCGSHMKLQQCLI